MTPIHHAMRAAAAAGLLSLLPSLAYAHTGTGTVHAVTHGLVHPLVGADHVLALLAVGVWAAQRGGRALWALPAAFLVAMGVGFAVGASGVVLPAVELGVVASVFVLGLLALGAVRMPAVGAGLVVSAFAVFHGHAHAADMPAGALLAGYGAGLAASSAVLLATAGGLALFARHVGAMQRFAAERVAGGVYVNIFRLPISGR